ncbi:unnamed protein product [Auanema sp. JU1783]|nr:unnamed protein product [Auanema sp. JU1783]
MRSCSRQLSFCIIIVTIFICIVELSKWSSCGLDQTPKPSHDFCLDGFLESTRAGANVGDVMFELMSFISLAYDTNRAPVMTDVATKEGVEKILKVYPEISRYLFNAHNASYCSCPNLVIVQNKKCCSHDSSLDQYISKQRETTIQVKFSNSKSYKYFDSFPKELLNIFFTSTATVGFHAGHQLFKETKDSRYFRRNLCVHVHRSHNKKILNNAYSKADFTIAALSHMISLESFESKVDIYVMTNDLPWAQMLFTNFKRTYIAEIDERDRPTVGWEFSRRFCDKVLLTSTMSSYGWWLAYLSRGQMAFYDGDSTTYEAFHSQITPSHYWLPKWMALKYLPSNKQVIPIVLQDV